MECVCKLSEHLLTTAEFQLVKKILKVFCELGILYYPIYFFQIIGSKKALFEMQDTLKFPSSKLS